MHHRKFKGIVWGPYGYTVFRRSDMFTERIRARQYIPCFKTVVTVWLTINAPVSHSFTDGVTTHLYFMQ
jgi:hypothetical protein